MAEDLIIENYVEEDSFESFYKKHKPKIVEALKGKKMRKRHLKNAKKLLKESAGLPAEAADSIIIEAVTETVNEAPEDGFEGNAFDHFKFAKKIRQMAEKKTGKKISRISLKNVSQVLKKGLLKPKRKRFNPAASKPAATTPVPGTDKAQVQTQVNSQTPNPATTGSETKTEPFIQPQAATPATASPSTQEEKANAIANNGQLTAPSLAMNSGPTSGESGDEEALEAALEEPETTASLVAENNTTQAKSETQANNNASQNTAPPAKDKTQEQEKPEAKKGDRKWIMIAGAVGLLIVIALILLLRGKGTTVTTIHN